MWILIVIIMGSTSNYPTRLTMQEFTSQERCQAAGEVVMRGMMNHPHRTGWAGRSAKVECVER